VLIIEILKYTKENEREKGDKSVWRISKEKDTDFNK
jgi:hypothetical protein